MSCTDSYDLPPHTAAPAEAVDRAAHGEVVYLFRNGKPMAAIVPPRIALAVAGAIEALEDAEDIRAADAALAEPGPDIPMSEIWAEYADVLGPYPGPEDQRVRVTR